MSDNCGSCSSGSCGSHDKKDPVNREIDDQLVITERLARVKHTVVVLSGKGGVGKSTVAVNLAAALCKSGKSVGILDVDIHGPSVPKMFGMSGAHVEASEGVIYPVDTGYGLKMMSIAFFLKDNDAIIWRGPLKMGVIKQFIRDVEWGDLDYLIIDCPPGTGDEPLSVAQLFGKLSGAIVVTTPQDVAVDAVRRSISFCNQLNMPMLGIVENMAGFVCPDCGKKYDIFGSKGGSKLAEATSTELLESIPLSAHLAEFGDGGRPVAYDAENPIGAVYRDLAAKIDSKL